MFEVFPTWNIGGEAAATDPPKGDSLSFGSDLMRLKLY